MISASKMKSENLNWFRKLTDGTGHVVYMWSMRKEWKLFLNIQAKGQVSIFVLSFSRSFLRVESPFPLRPAGLGFHQAATGRWGRVGYGLAQSHNTAFIIKSSGLAINNAGQISCPLSALSVALCTALVGEQEDSCCTPPHLTLPLSQVILSILWSWIKHEWDRAPRMTWEQFLPLITPKPLTSNASWPERPGGDHTRQKMT